MLDAYLYPKLSSAYQRLLKPLKHSFLEPEHVTILGFGFGLWAAVEIWRENYLFTLLPFLLNRIFDGLDGALARVKGKSSASGGFLDICLDFCIYGLVTFSFALASPSRALCAAFLLFAYYLTGTSFLALSSALAKIECPVLPPFRHKSLHFISGLCEGTETIVVMCAMLVFPDYYCLIGYLFGSLCILTAMMRVAQGYRQLKISSSRS